VLQVQTVVFRLVVWEQVFAFFVGVIGAAVFPAEAQDIRTEGGGYAVCVVVAERGVVFVGVVFGVEGAGEGFGRHREGISDREFQGLESLNGEMLVTVRHDI